MTTTTKRVALYLRVSTGEQKTENQRQALEAWAARRGYTVAAVFEDAGISGAKGRDRRPGFDRMLKAAVRGEFDIVGAWSVCRLGRSLPHLVSTLQELHAAKVALYLDQQALDTSTPSGEAMYGMLGVFAQFERRMIQARVNAGLARARKQGKTLGRPSLPAATRDKLRTALVSGRVTVREAAKIAKVSKSAAGDVRSALVSEGLLDARAAIAA